MSTNVQLSLQLNSIAQNKNILDDVKARGNAIRYGIAYDDTLDFIALLKQVIRLQLDVQKYIN